METLNLSTEYVNFLMQVLGELPTRTGAFNVMQAIDVQRQQAAKAAEETKAE